MKIDTSLRNKAGVYKITNVINNKSYIGSSFDIYNRLHVYPSLNKHKRVHNKHLQNSFTKYGIDNFIVSILEFLDISTLKKDEIREELRILEQKWVNIIKPEYNKRKNVDLNCQVSPTKETRDKISNSLKEAFLNGTKKIDRVQKHSTKVTLFDLQGNLIERFPSAGLLAEFIGRKGQSLLRHAYCKGSATQKCGDYLIYLTSEEDKVLPYKEIKKNIYVTRTKRNKTS